MWFMKVTVHCGHTNLGLSRKLSSAGPVWYLDGRSSGNGGIVLIRWRRRSKLADLLSKLVNLQKISSQKLRKLKNLFPLNPKSFHVCLAFLFQRAFLFFFYSVPNKNVVSVWHQWSQPSTLTLFSAKRSRCLIWPSRSRGSTVVL